MIFCFCNFILFYFYYNIFPIEFDKNTIEENREYYLL